MSRTSTGVARRKQQINKRIFLGQAKTVLERRSWDFAVGNAILIVSCILCQEENNVVPPHLGKIVLSIIMLV